MLVGVIALVAVAVAANYILVALRRPASGGVPPMISSELRRSAEGVEILVKNGDVLRFTVRARRLRETVRDTNHLEGIDASDFNRDGSVRNSIHSEQAVYDPGRKVIDFSGDVLMSLDGGIELRAEALHYDLGAETGDIPGEMRLASRSVSGHARDVRFFRNEERLELGGGVDFSLAGALGGAPPADAVRARAARGVFSLAENRIRFEGGVRIDAAPRGALSGEEVSVGLSPARDRVTSMAARGAVSYEMQDQAERRSLGGERMEFSTGATGRLDKIAAEGGARLQVASAAKGQSLSAGRIEVLLDDGTGGISELRGEDAARLQSRDGGREVVAAGDLIQASFAAASGKGGGDGGMGRATLRDVRIEGKAGGGARLTQSQVEAGDGATQTEGELEADAIQASFRVGSAGATGVGGLAANGAVRWRFAMPKAAASPIRRLTAGRLEIRYAPDADAPESGEASGRVTLEESDDAARLTRRLSAERLRFRFFPGSGQLRSLDADQDVRVAYARGASTAEKGVASGKNAGGAAKGGEGEGYETSSDRLEALFELRDGAVALGKAAQWGRFHFRSTVGAAREVVAERCEYAAAGRKLVLTGTPEASDADGSVKGERMEYDLGARSLRVRGGVRAVLGARAAGEGAFPGADGGTPVVVTAQELRRQASGRFQFTGGVRAMAEGQQLSAQELLLDGGGRVEARGGVSHRIVRSGGAQAQASEALVVSEALDYRREGGGVRYFGGVSLRSRELALDADVLDGVLDEGAKSLRNVRASGGVVARFDGRVARGDVAEWEPATGKGSVTGAPAEIDDPARGKSFARRLVYVQGEGRITLEP